MPRDDDFCLIHGADYMVSEMGNPIPYCSACEEEHEREERAREEHEQQLLEEERRLQESEYMRRHYEEYPHG